MTVLFGVDTIQFSDVDHAFYHVNLNDRFQVFHCEVTRNLLLFSPRGTDVTKEEMVGFISYQAFCALLQVLQHTTELVIHFEQETKGGTTKITVYEGLIVPSEICRSYHKLYDYLKRVEHHTPFPTNQYTWIKGTERFNLLDVVGPLS